MMVNWRAERNVRQRQCADGVCCLQISLDGIVTDVILLLLVLPGTRVLMG